MMPKSISIAFIAVLQGTCWTHVAKAQENASERHPKRVFSISENPRFEQDSGGQLFKKMKLMLAAADQGNGAAFAKYLSKGAKLELFVLSDSGLQVRPFGIRTIKAASRECIGPYPFAEGPSWVQLSWLCAIQKGSTLSTLVAFRDSPELAMTVWFEKSKIKTIIAGEPLSVPGARRFVMDAVSASELKK